MNGIQIYANLVQLINREQLACFFLAYSLLLLLWRCYNWMLSVASWANNFDKCLETFHFLSFRDIGSSISFVGRHAVSPSERARERGERRALFHKFSLLPFGGKYLYRTKISRIFQIYPFLCVQQINKYEIFIAIRIRIVKMALIDINMSFVLFILLFVAVVVGLCLIFVLKPLINMRRKISTYTTSIPIETLKYVLTKYR